MTWKSILVSTTVAVGIAMVTSGSAFAAEKREAPKYGGTLNVLTMYSMLNALGWNHKNWMWKSNHDGLNLDHLIAGDLDKGPRGTNEFEYRAQAYLPEKVWRGELAESWDVKQNPLRLEFKLRKGVFWPAKEGVMEKREVVADDITYHFKTMSESKRKIPTYWDFIKEWKSTDKYTAVAYLNSYNANWGYRIGWGYYDAIIPPEVHNLNDGKGPKDWTQVNGTGPYKVSKVTKGREHIYEKNEDYWDTETINGIAYKLPYNDKVVYNIVKDEATRIALLRSGKVDLYEAFRPHFVKALRDSAPELIIREALATQGTFIALRTDKKPFDNKKVRQAMNLAVNQQEILDTLLFGKGEILNYPFSSGWKSLYTPIEKLKPSSQMLFDYDPEKAKKLLAEAGYADGFDFEVMVSTADPYHMDVIGLLQAYYANVGITLKAKTLEYAAFRSQMRKPSQSAGYLMNNGEGNPFSVLRKSYKSGQTWNPAFTQILNSIKNGMKLLRRLIRINVQKCSWR
ncbi:MAG: ABC transporter substrate-binding protein [Sneathiella sp.]|nr:ABC transporter substrate-binding protein [Sneathiella sp.]